MNSTSVPIVWFSHEKPENSNSTVIHFHAFASNQAEVFANINFSIISGLVLIVSSNYELINDQVAIPVADLSLEEILLEQRYRATHRLTTVASRLGWSRIMRI